jgi:hypothetical protein
VENGRPPNASYIERDSAMEVKSEGHSEAAEGEVRGREGNFRSGTSEAEVPFCR